MNMKSFTNMFADLLNDGRPGRSSSSSSAPARGAPGGSSAAAASTSTWVGFDDEAPSASDFSAPAVATHPGFPAPSRGVAKPEDSVHPLTRQWASRIGNRAVRDAFLAHPIEDYTSSHELSVWTGTWNTNGKRPPPGLDISPWLDAAVSKPDIVVVGFQEIVPLTPGKVLAVEDEKATREWEAIIERALHEGGGGPQGGAGGPRGASSSTAGWASFDGDDNGAWTSFDAASSEDGRRSGGDTAGGDTAGGGSEAAGAEASGAEAPSRRYVRLACKQLVGVYITVWATTEAASHVRDVRVATVSTGFNLGVGALQVATLGNKGGAAVWLKIYNTPALFVCSHLSAGSKPDDAAKRSQDYHDIVSKLSFPAPPAASSDGAVERSASVKDAFASVWIGDLNYRLNLPDDTVRDAIAGGTHAKLLSADQLVLEQAAGRAFVGWTEAPVTFLPTYKYRPGTNQYSGGGDVDDDDEDGGDVKVSKKEEKKKRAPAWCDRILWRGWDITQLSYDRSELVQSDHKPVRSKFSIVARELQPERLQEVLLEHRRRMDFQEMASQPRCTLENPVVDVGELWYAEPKTCSFRLVNVGDVAASWRFVPAGGGSPGDAAVSPGWIELDPPAGVLLPGAEVTIGATMCVAGGGTAGPAFVSGVLGGGEDEGERLSASNAASTTGPGGGGARVTPPSTTVAPTTAPTTASSSASTVAEAARIAAARAVNRGLLKPVESGGVAFVSEGERRNGGGGSSHGGSPRGGSSVSGNDSATDLVALSSPLGSSAWDLDAEPKVGLDGILVLHLENGRDFFLTVNALYAPSTFGKPLRALRKASFPPDVPEPIRAMVDRLFDHGASHPGLLRPPARATLENLALVRRALDASHVSGAAADLSGIQPDVVGFALLAFFAATPTPLLATPARCATRVDEAMARWSAAAVDAARRSSLAGGAWTLSSPDVAGLLPSRGAVEELVRSCADPAASATFAHVVALLSSLFGRGSGPGSSGSFGSFGSSGSFGSDGGGGGGSVTARSLAQFAEVWFPRDDGADAGTRMGRVAFLGAACGCEPNFLDGFNPARPVYDVQHGRGIVAEGNGSGAGSGTDGFTPAPGPAASGFESAAAAASGFSTGTGNLIDI